MGDLLFCKPMFWNVKAMPCRLSAKIRLSSENQLFGSILDFSFWIADMLNRFALSTYGSITKTKVAAKSRWMFPCKS
jgi:hypothetical protein